MEQCYPKASFRYPRGLVSPDLPGLDSKPAFPDDWNIAAEDVLRESLIHGVADRSEIEAAIGTENDQDTES
jgi:hypothetical protein